MFWVYPHPSSVESGLHLQGCLSLIVGFTARLIYYYYYYYYNYYWPCSC
jgi:hypothetical protein